MTLFDASLHLIGLGATIQAVQCLVISFQDITKFKDYKR